MVGISQDSVKQAQQLDNTRLSIKLYRANQDEEETLYTINDEFTSTDRDLPYSLLYYLLAYAYLQST